MPNLDSDEDDIAAFTDAAPQRGEATANDVAQAAGVSRIMVSRAFNPNASIRADKRQHIRQIAGSLGYHPDMAARSMATGKSNLVAFLVPSLARSWESQELDALIARLQKNGMAALVFRVPPHQLDPADLVQVRAYKPAAVVVFMDRLAPDELAPLFGNSPAIYPHYGDQLPQPIPGYAIDRLHINQHAGVRSAVKLLAGSGRKKIVYVTGDDYESRVGAENSNSVRDRHASFLAAMASHDLTPAAEIEGMFDYQTARQNVGNFVRNGGKADAYFAANDTSAFGVMDALRHDLGMRVPEDCAVIGFDNIRESAWAAYDLTTVGLSIDARVEALMRLLKTRIADPEGPARIETVTASLVVRSST